MLFSVNSSDDDFILLNQIHASPNMTKSAPESGTDYKIHIFIKGGSDGGGQGRSIGFSVPPSMLMAGRSTL